MGQQSLESAVTRAKVFISYSRADALFAQMLVTALTGRGFDAFIDDKDIAPGEPWKERLAGLIAAADTIVLAVSPDSIASSVCAWEVEEGSKLGKRIIPIIARQIEVADAPSALKRLNWIPCTDRDDRNVALAKLEAGLRTDLTWVREHTRLGELARHWEDQGRGKGATLRGAELETAERWLDRRPVDANPPTSLHRDFIRSSRRASTVRLRYWVGGSLVVALVAIGLAGFAEISRREAMSQRVHAETATKEAVASADAAKLSAKQTQEELAAAQRSESLSLAEQAIHDVDAGDVSQALSHGIKALPKDLTQPDRPVLRKAEFALQGPFSRTGSGSRCSRAETRQTRRSTAQTANTSRLELAMAS